MNKFSSSNLYYLYIRIKGFQLKRKGISFVTFFVKNYFSLSLFLVHRVIECSDLPVTNGGCNPYAMVTLTYSKTRNKADIKRTTVKKKTTCPQFNECFQFEVQ